MPHTTKIQKLEIEGKLYDIIVPKNWNQADPTAVDFIENRTHWAEPIRSSTGVLLQTIIPANTGPFNRLDLAFEPALKVGDWVLIESEIDDSAEESLEISKHSVSKVIQVGSVDNVLEFKHSRDFNVKVYVKAESQVNHPYVSTEIVATNDTGSKSSSGLKFKYPIKISAVNILPMSAAYLPLDGESIGITSDGKIATLRQSELRYAGDLKVEANSGTSPFKYIVNSENNSELLKVFLSEYKKAVPTTLATIDWFTNPEIRFSTAENDKKHIQIIIQITDDKNIAKTEYDKAIAAEGRLVPTGTFSTFSESGTNGDGEATELQTIKMCIDTSKSEKVSEDVTLSHKTTLDGLCFVASADCATGHITGDADNIYELQPDDLLIILNGEPMRMRSTSNIPLSVGNYPTSLRGGEIDTSVVNAMGPYTFAFGKNIIAGRKGFYYSNFETIDLAEGSGLKITLSNQQQITGKSAEISDSDIATLIDAITNSHASSTALYASLVNDEKFENYFRVIELKTSKDDETGISTYQLICEIPEGLNLDKLKPATMLEADMEEDDFSVSFVTLPELGPANLKTGNIVFGASNQGLGNDSLIAGRRNIVYGDYGFAVGRGNVVGHCSSALGVNNEVKADYALAVGGDNIIDHNGDKSIVAGDNNYVNGAHNLVVGENNSPVDDDSGEERVAGVYGAKNIVAGAGNKVVGDENLVVGSSNNVTTATSSRNIIGGLGNKVTTQKNLVVGQANTVDNSHNLVGGTGNTITGEKNISAGAGTITEKIDGKDVTISSTISGNSNLVVGEVNDVGGNKNLVGGSKNKLVNKLPNEGSSSTYACSSLVVGEQNQVRGNASNQASHIVGGMFNQVGDTNNIVGGNNNTVTGARNILGGQKNKVTSKHNIVSGEAQNITGYNNIVSGQSRNVSGSENIVNGYGSNTNNTVSGQANVVNGENQIVTGNKNAVYGGGNSVSTDLNAVSGDGHTVNGTANIIGGRSNKTTTRSNLIMGRLNSVSGKENNDGYGENIVGGNSHTLSGNRNIVAGSGSISLQTADDKFTTFKDNVSGHSNVVAGESHTISGSSNLVVGEGAYVLTTIDNDKNTIYTQYADNISGNSNVIAGTTNKVSSNGNLIGGFNNTVKGNGANNGWHLVTGYSNEVSDFENIVGGERNIIKSCRNLVVGSGNTVESQRNIVGGQSNSLGTNCTNNLVVGANNKASSSNAIIGGTWNATPDNLLFAIGIGSNNNNRKNAFEICAADDKNITVINNGTLTVEKSTTLKGELSVTGSTALYDNLTMETTTQATLYDLIVKNSASLKSAYIEDVYLGGTDSDSAPISVTSSGMSIKSGTLAVNEGALLNVNKAVISNASITDSLTVGNSENLGVGQSSIYTPLVIQPESGSSLKVGTFSFDGAYNTDFAFTTENTSLLISSELSKTFIKSGTIVLQSPSKKQDGDTNTTSVILGDNTACLKFNDEEVASIEGNSTCKLATTAINLTTSNLIINDNTGWGAQVSLTQQTGDNSFNRQLSIDGDCTVKGKFTLESFWDLPGTVDSFTNNMASTFNKTSTFNETSIFNKAIITGTYANTNDNTIFAIGNGTGSEESPIRSNAFEICKSDTDNTKLIITAADSTTIKVNGMLSVPEPSADDAAANKQYVDDEIKKITGTGDDSDTTLTGLDNRLDTVESYIGISKDIPNTIEPLLKKNDEETTTYFLNSNLSFNGEVLGNYSIFSEEAFSKDNIDPYDNDGTAQALELNGTDTNANTLVPIGYLEHWLQTRIDKYLKDYLPMPTVEGQMLVARKFTVTDAAGTETDILKWTVAAKPTELYTGETSEESITE